MRKKGMEVRMIVGLVVAGLIIGAAFIWMNNEWGGGAVQAGGSADVPLVTKDTCDQSDNKNDLDLAVRNPKNVSLHYEAPTIVATKSDGTIVDSDTATAGSTVSYKTLDIPCDVRTGNVYALMSSAMNSQVSSFDFGNETTVTKEITAAPAGSLKIVAMDSTYTNTTDAATVDSSDAGCTETEVGKGVTTTVEAGGSFTRYVDYKQASAYKAFGSEVTGKPGILIGIDNNNASSWNEGDIQISSVEGSSALKRVDCSDYPDIKATDSLDECYVDDDIASNDPTRRYRIQGTANRGNPYSDIDVYFYPLGFFQDTDGKIRYGYYDSGGTAKGQSVCQLTIDLA